MTIQRDFANRIVEIIRPDRDIIGLAAAGSWITNELDEYSDLDLVLITKEKISHDPGSMKFYAAKFGNLIAAFTGEHVGEPRVLICLYKDPLLHLDIKFLTPDEFRDRVEDPIIIFERDGEITKIIQQTTAHYPTDSFQWIEDRFWVWVHYLAARLGRGEYFECLDGLAYIRSRVLGPLLHLKNGFLPRGVRKIESHIDRTSLDELKQTVCEYEPKEIGKAIHQSIFIYRKLRKELFQDLVIPRDEAEIRSEEYLNKIVSTL